MIIINTEYFQGEIYLPHAKPGISSGVKDVENKVQSFMEDYVLDYINKSFGPKLANEFINELDDAEANGLKSGADQKWDNLLNGMTYTNPAGDEVIWRGIRRKSNSTGDYNRSFLANYVYFHYESSDFTTRGGTGNVKVQAANAENDNTSYKSVKAWRRFAEWVEGTNPSSPYGIKGGFLGGPYVDYFAGSEEVFLYRFVNDQNELIEDTYADFTPISWGNINQFSI